MSAELVRAWLLGSARVIHERRAWLTELDAAIGDGDHGINLDRGFALVAAHVARADPAAADAAELLESTGRLILGAVGGASGALYGRAFQRAGARLGAGGGGPAGAGAARSAPGGGSYLGIDNPWEAAELLATAIEAIVALGRAGPGDKTMLDALLPAERALRAATGEGLGAVQAFRRAADAAEKGAQDTVPLVARRGRASYLGARSAGHLDPGAASSALLLRALAEVAASGPP